MKIIGIDFGTKKVGVALSDEGATLAFPVDVFPRTKIEETIFEMAEKENAHTVVVGESTQFDMKDNPVMEEVRKFTKVLQEKGLEVVYENEFMSSMQASRIQGYNKKQDASAAAILLQSYLDKSRHQYTNETE